MKQCLIVVDYQKDFVDGSLGFPEAVLLDEKIAEKVEAYHAKDQDVIFTLDTHEENYMDTQEGKNLPIPHCIRGSVGWELYGKTAASRKEEDLLIEKPTFPSYELGALLREKAYDEIQLVGVVTDICVLSNAVIAKAALPEAKISVDASCTATMSEEMKQKTFDVMGSLQITVLNR
ncbi:MAG: cysteine hydrolase [Oscillospiraceae bacterium]|nr:cysteine hydrolase [Oscillospiraceae bacterium]